MCTHLMYHLSLLRRFSPPEDFTPRKGVMTRYGKKMVRADFYGTVTVQNLNVI